MNRILLLATLAAILTTRSSPSSLSSSPSLASGPMVGSDGAIYAVVEFKAALEEASNAGGEHDTFEIDEPGHREPRLAHGGGHGSWYGLSRRSLRPTASDYFIAELAMHPRRPYTYDHADGGWGTTTLPDYDAEVVRLVPMRDLETARGVLPRLAWHQVPFAALPLHDQLF